MGSESRRAGREIGGGRSGTGSTSEPHALSTVRVGRALDRLLEPLEDDRAAFADSLPETAAPGVVRETSVASECRRTRRAAARREGRRPRVSALPETLAPYERYSRVSGELCEPPADEPYQVAFRQLPGTHTARSYLVVVSSLLFVGGFFVWLMLPSQWPKLGNGLLVDTAAVLMTVAPASSAVSRSSTWRRSPGRRSWPAIRYPFLPSRARGLHSSRRSCPSGRAARGRSPDAGGGKQDPP